MVEISQVIASCIISFLVGAGLVLTYVTVFCIVYHVLKKQDEKKKAEEEKLRELMENPQKEMIQ